MGRKGLVVIVALVFSGVFFAPVLACDDRVGKCEVEDWRWYAAIGGLLVIEGSTTSDKGEIRIRLYDGTGEKRKVRIPRNGYGVHRGARLSVHDDQHPETQISVHQVQYRARGLRSWNATRHLCRPL